MVIPNYESTRAAIERALADVLPGILVDEVSAFRIDEASHDQATKKEAGYGKPLRVLARSSSGERHDFVFHTASADEFGHDRRSDRAKDMLLAYDTFPSIPAQAAALDVGAIQVDGNLTSLRHTGEFYLITEYKPGSLYADDLRSIAKRMRVEEHDLERCRLLAKYLADLHGDKSGDASQYRRAIRNLIGDGEGIYGMVDSFPPDTKMAAPARLQAIERRCAEWRWKVRGKEHRVSRIHGDFHPFNIVFNGDRLSLLDASRGCRGDPADDITALSVNYVFFALQHPGTWVKGFGPLWQTFWDAYLDETNDHGVLEVVPPYIAWRLLVVAHPKWYPESDPKVRDALLNIAERALDKGIFDPNSVMGDMS